MMIFVKRRLVHGRRVIKGGNTLRLSLRPAKKRPRQAKEPGEFKQKKHPATTLRDVWQRSQSQGSDREPGWTHSEIENEYREEASQGKCALTLVQFVCELEKIMNTECEYTMHSFLKKIRCLIGFRIILKPKVIKSLLVENGCEESAASDMVGKLRRFIGNKYSEWKVSPDSV